MFGIRLMLLLAVMGCIIAFIADKLGSKIGKKRLSVFGLRPHDTSVLLTVLSGVLISLFSIGILAVSSESARTALFGMEKLQKELLRLNEEKKSVVDEYDKAMTSLKQKNEEIADLDYKIKEADAAKALAEQHLNHVNSSLHEVQGQFRETQGALIAAKNEVKSLTEARERLDADIKNLEQETERLQKGIVAMRDGQMVYRGGEVVFAGILQGGLSMDENRKQMNWLLEGANNAALTRLGLEKEPETEMVWTPREEYVRTLDVLNNEKGNILVRVRSLANTVLGQPLLCGLEVIPNKLIYKDGKMIYQKIVLIRYILIWQIMNMLEDLKYLNTYITILLLIILKLKMIV